MANLFERGAQKVVSRRVLRRQLDGLAQQIHGFRKALELTASKPEQAEGVDILRFEFEDLGISRGRVRNRTAAVHVQRVL